MIGPITSNSTELNRPNSIGLIWCNSTRLAAIKLIPICLLALTGCSYLPKQIVEVPVRISCVAAVPAKPSRLTPCPPEITNSQCVKRAAIDIERLDSALDQSNEMLKACI